MAVFGVELRNDAKARTFLKDNKKRFEGKDLIKNPFDAYLKIIPGQKNDEYISAVLSMRPLWPNFSPFVALILTFSFYIFGVAKPWFIVPVFFLVLGFFWTENFFYFIFVAGLKKAGYKGPVKKLRKDALIDRIARVL